MKTTTEQRIEAVRELAVRTLEEFRECAAFSEFAPATLPDEPPAEARELDGRSKS